MYPFAHAFPQLEQYIKPSHIDDTNFRPIFNKFAWIDNQACTDVFQFINLQGDVIKTLVSLYTVTYNDAQCTVLENVENKYIERSRINSHMNIDVSDTHITISVIAKDVLLKYFDTYDREVFFMFVLYSKIDVVLEEYDHMALLVINLKQKNMYMIEPNASADIMFGKYLDNGISNYIDCAFERYASDLSFKYVKHYELNPFQVCINPGPFCVLVTIFIAHILSLYPDSDPQDIIQQIHLYDKKFAGTQFSYRNMIIDYGTNIYPFLKKSLELVKIGFMDKIDF